MRRLPHLMAGFLVIKGLLVIRDGFLVSSAGLGAVLAPILLNSCQNVQPEETTGERGAVEAGTPEGGTPEAGRVADTPPTDPAPIGDGLEAGTARPQHAGVVPTASSIDANGLAGASGPPTRISATTRRTARGLPAEMAGYASWNVLEDPGGGVVPEGTEDECRAYIDLPLDVEATIGERLELPLAPGTRIVIESKRARDDFIRRIDTLERAELGWEPRCYVRDRPTESFREEAPESHPDEAACRKLLDSIARGEAALVLGE